METILVAGYSVGGSAVLYWIDYIDNFFKKMNPSISTKGYLEGGIFLDSVVSTEKEVEFYKFNEER
jgi:hypothetical protein